MKVARSALLIHESRAQRAPVSLSLWERAGVRETAMASSALTDKRARHRAGTDWDRRLSSRLRAPGARCPRRAICGAEAGGCPCRAAGRTTAHVALCQPRRRRGIEPRGSRAGWKAGDPGQPPTGTAGFQPASRAGGSMPPARDLRRGSRAVAHAAPPGGRPRMWPCASPGDADAASSRVGAEPAGKPAIPVSRGLGAPAFSRLRVPGARCPRRAICGAEAGRLPMPRRRADDRACGLVPAQATPTRHRAAPTPSRLESRRSRSAADWDRRLSAGFACRGLDAPGARSAAREPGGCPCRAAGRTTARVPSYQLRRRRRGIEPRRRRAGWKAGDPGQPRTGSAGFQPASRAGGSMPPARDLRRGSRAVAHAAPPGGRLRVCPLISSDGADAASSRARDLLRRRSQLAAPGRAGCRRSQLAAPTPSRLESRRSQLAASAPSRLESRRSQLASAPSRLESRRSRCGPQSPLSGQVQSQRTR
jgi:hypothetical protein